MNDEPQTIEELEAGIRDFINEPRKSRFLREKSHVWSQICASLDAIGDSLLAINAYPISAARTNSGTLYLSIYGLLQACFLQQDAIQNLCEALQLEDSYKDYPQLLTVRELRNDAVGHPTKRKPRPPHRYCSISRVSMSYDGFQMMIEQGEGRPEFRTVSLVEVIADQKTYVRKLLASVLAKLELEMREHKERFNMTKLADLFPETLGYAFEKLSQGIYESGPDGDGHAGFGLWGLNEIQKTLTSVQVSLANRGLELGTYVGVGYLYDEVRYPMDRLQEFLEAKKAHGEASIDEKTALIFASFLRAKINELREMAVEIDADYAS